MGGVDVYGRRGAGVAEKIVDGSVRVCDVVPELREEDEKSRRRAKRLRSAFARAVDQASLLEEQAREQGR